MIDLEKYNKQLQNIHTVVKAEVEKAGYIVGATVTMHQDIYKLIYVKVNPTSSYSNGGHFHVHFYGVKWLKSGKWGQREMHLSMLVSLCESPEL